MPVSAVITIMEQYSDPNSSSSLNTHHSGAGLNGLDLDPEKSMEDRERGRLMAETPRKKGAIWSIADTLEDGKRLQQQTTSSSSSNSSIAAGMERRNV